MELSRLGNQGVYVCNGDILILSLTTSDASGSVVIRGRVLYRDHEIMPFERVCTFSGTGTQTDVVATLTEGYLLGFDVSRASGDLGEGEVIASVHVGRNAGNIQQKMMCLASGEVSNIRSLGMGGFTAAGTVSVPATLTVAGTIPQFNRLANPAPGQEFVWTVPAGEYWENPIIFGWLNTSAAVANREVQLVIQISGVTYVRYIVANTQTATQAIAYQFAPSGQTYQSTSIKQFHVGIPALTLGPGWQARIYTVGLDVADQWNEPSIVYNKRTV